MMKRFLIMTVFSAFLFPSAVYALGEGKDKVFEECKKSGRVDWFCNCLTGTPYDDAAEKLIKTTETRIQNSLKVHNVTVERVNKHPSVTPARLSEVCAIYDDRINFAKSRGFPMHGHEGKVETYKMSSEQKKSWNAKTAEAQGKVQALAKKYGFSKVSDLTSIKNGYCASKYYLDNLKAELRSQKFQAPLGDLVVHVPRKNWEHYAKQCRP